MTTNITAGSGVWQVDAPNNVDPNDVTDTYDPVSNTLTVTFDMKAQDIQLSNDAHFPHGIEFLTFTAPPAPPAQGFGIRTNLIVKVINDTGVKMEGFDLRAQNSTYPIAPDVGGAHPTNYAHFHGETGATFPGGGLVFYAPNGTVAPGGAAGNNPAANEIVDGASIASGATLTSAAFTLHNEEVPGQDNSFTLSLQPLSTQETVPPAIIGASTTLGTGYPYALTTIRDTTGHPDSATIILTDSNGISSDFVGKFAPSRGLTETIPGVYILAANDPAGLTSELHTLVFSQGPESNNGSIILDINNGASASARAITKLVVGTSFPGTYVNNDSGFIKDTNGNVWSIDNSKVNVNEFDDADTGRVVALAYVNGQVWQENADKLWWSKTLPTDTWSPAAGTPVAPETVPLQASGNNAVVTTASQAIVDASQDTWSIVDGQVDVSGTIDPTTLNVIELAYVDGKVWQENSSQLWWAKTSSADPWDPAYGVSTSPLPITIAPLQASVTVTQSQVTVGATAGNHMVFISGSGDTANLSGGTDTITDTGSNNTYVVPRAGNGYDIFTNNILDLGDTLDLRSALNATTWDGSPSTLSNYLTVTDNAQGAVLSIATTLGGTAVGVATIDGATTATLSSLLPHSLT